MRNKKKKRKRTGLKLIGLVVLMLCGIVSYKRIDLDKKAEQYQQTLKDYDHDIQDLENEAKEIEDLKAYVETKGYIEQMAREKLGLVYDDEIIFKANK